MREKGGGEVSENAKVRYRFWIKSNRGTDESAEVELPADVTGEADIRGYLEDWCANFGAWHHSDNVVRYGYERVGA